MGHVASCWLPFFLFLVSEVLFNYDADDYRGTRLAPGSNTCSNNASDLYGWNPHSSRPRAEGDHLPREAPQSFNVATACSLATSNDGFNAVVLEVQSIRCQECQVLQSMRYTAHSLLRTTAGWCTVAREQDWQSTQSWAAVPSAEPARSPSPPDRRAWSPRGRSKGKSHGKPDGKAKGEGKGKADGKQRISNKQAAPDLQSLPAPPQIPQLPSPATTAIQEEAPSAAQFKLDALVAALKGSSSTLPPEVVDLFGEQVEAQTKDMSKAMHQAVNQKARAAREIHRVRAGRRSFLDAWARYAAHLATTLEDQIKKQAEAMEEFNSREQSWQAQLAESNEQLARLSGDVQHVPSDLDADMDSKERIAAMEEDP